MTLDDIGKTHNRFTERTRTIDCATCGQWEVWGVVEVAARNPQVAEYCAHWEDRTEKAEKRCAELERMLFEIKKFYRAHGYLPERTDYIPWIAPTVSNPFRPS